MPTESAAWGCSPQGPQPEAEAGIVEDDPGDEEENERHGGGEVELLEEGGQEVLVDLSCDTHGLGGQPGPGWDGDVGEALALDGPGHDGGEGRGEDVEGGAADGLVRP